MRGPSIRVYESSGVIAGYEMGDHSVSYEILICGRTSEICGPGWRLILHLSGKSTLEQGKGSEGDEDLC